MKCPNCGSDNPGDMNYCGKCGCSLKMEQRPGLIETVAANAGGLGALAEKMAPILMTLLEKWQAPREREQRDKKLLSIAVLLVIALIAVMTFYLTSTGSLDNGAFTLLMGALIGSLITFLGDLVFSD